MSVSVHVCLRFLEKEALMEDITNHFGKWKTDIRHCHSHQFCFLCVRLIHERLIELMWNTQEVTLLCTQCLYAAICSLTLFSSLYTLDYTHVHISLGVYIHGLQAEGQFFILFGGTWVDKDSTSYVRCHFSTPRFQLDIHIYIYMVCTCIYGLCIHVYCMYMYVCTYSYGLWD